MNANKTSRFADETHVAAPLGKQTVRGIIVSTRASDTDYGTSYKMLVKVTTPAGTWLCWSTVPQKLFDQANEKIENNRGLIEEIKGCEVQFSATLETGRDAHFCFAKRPTKPVLVSFPADKARTTGVWGCDATAREEADTEAMFAAFEPAAA